MIRQNFSSCVLSTRRSGNSGHPHTPANSGLIMCRTTWPFWRKRMCFHWQFAGCSRIASYTLTQHVLLTLAFALFPRESWRSLSNSSGTSTSSRWLLCWSEHLLSWRSPSTPSASKSVEARPVPSLLPAGGSRLARKSPMVVSSALPFLLTIGGTDDVSVGMRKVLLSVGFPSNMQKGSYFIKCMFRWLPICGLVQLDHTAHIELLARGAARDPKKCTYLLFLVELETSQQPCNCKSYILGSGGNPWNTC